MSAVQTYDEFIAGKQIITPDAGLTISPDALNPQLFQFQRDIVSWSLRKGRSAIFADCGLGKTPMQLSWAQQVPGQVLILAPLAVSQQTVREGKKFGIEVHYSRSPIDAHITVTNYEMLEHFDVSRYAGIVLDESSILKAYDGKFRSEIIAAFSKTPFRLACTATPAPNDYMELGNHAEFLGALTRTEMLSTFFVHDGGDTSKWRVKRHAERDFWKWACSWAVMIRKPSDLGYADDGFILPPIHFHDHTVDAQGSTDGRLFHMPAATLEERRHARSTSTDERARAVAAIVATRPTEPWLIWCNLNIESQAAAKLIPQALEICGSDSREDKEKRMLMFSSGLLRVLVTKPSIAGYGMNWQHCRNVVFLGLSDSYEQFYQAVRRCWRFGQQKEVDCYIVTAANEGAVTENIKRKEKDAAKMAEEMVSNMHELNQAEVRGNRIREACEVAHRVERGEDWELHLGDVVETIKTIPDESIHYSIFSPPFASLYTYSASPRDMGNCRTHAEFYAHFRYLARHLYRVTKPGRLVSFHAMEIPRMKERDGVIGLLDFPAKIRDIFEDCGFIYHSRVCIWKDPLIEATRTKALGLMHKQVMKDSAMCRQGLPDYLITVRKPGENAEPIDHPEGFTEFVGENEPTAPKRPATLKWSNFEQDHAHSLSITDDPTYSHQVWRRYASPVWMDINQTETLNRESAREDEDERHICPLQLEVIRRGLLLWSNPGDLVLSPFAGIGSEGYVALQQGRRFIGCELKESYFLQAVGNLKNAKSLTAPLFAERAAD